MSTTRAGVCVRYREKNLPDQICIKYFLCLPGRVQQYLGVSDLPFDSNRSHLSHSSLFYFILKSEALPKSRAIGSPGSFQAQYQHFNYKNIQILRYSYCCNASCADSTKALQTFLQNLLHSLCAVCWYGEWNLQHQWH